jgi:hypothetical protein
MDVRGASFAATLVIAWPWLERAAGACSTAPAHDDNPSVLAPIAGSTVAPDFVALFHFTAEPAVGAVEVVQPDESRLDGTTISGYGNALDSSPTRSPILPAVEHWMLFAPRHPLAAGGPYHLRVGDRDLPSFHVAGTSSPAAVPRALTATPQLTIQSIAPDCSRCDFFDSCKFDSCRALEMVVVDTGTVASADNFFVVEREGNWVASSPEPRIGFYSDSGHTCVTVRRYRLHGTLSRRTRAHAVRGEGAARAFERPSVPAGRSPSFSSLRYG